MLHSVPSTATHIELESLHGLGMIEVVPVVDSPINDRSKYYVRTTSPIWEVAQAAVSAAEVLFPE